MTAEPKIITKRETQEPYVRIEPTSDDLILNDSNLPQGIKLTGGEKLRAKGLTGKGVRVAVIDSGVDADHTGFNGRVVEQKWFRSGKFESGHGTHVAGTIHMMAPDAEIYDYRVFGPEGSFEVDDAIYTSIYEAVFDGCDVINMSLGGAFPSSGIRGAVEFAHSKGVIVVCAAGNEGDGNPLTNERSFPGLWDEAISIAAVSKQENLPVVSFSNTNPQVDYAGIGVDVSSFKPGGGFFTQSGTSMACPHVTGLITALLSGEIEFDKSRGKKKEWYRELRLTLDLKYAVDIGKEGRDNESGMGFLTYLDKTEFSSMF